MVRPIAFLTLLAACNGGFQTFPTDSGIPTDPNLEADTDTDADSDTDADTDTDTDTDSDTEPNNPPSADAGVDQSHLAGTAVTLDASASTDPDGDVLSYFWTMADSPPGWSGNIINPDRVTAQFFADTPGEYEAEVTVDDGEYTSTDSVFITVEEPNDQPVANAGFDEAVEVGDPVSLDGSGSYDPNGDVLTYEWTMVNKPAASNAVLNGAQGPTPSFTADEVGVFSIELVVDDGLTSSDPDIVRITASTQGGFDTGSGSGSCGLGCVQAQSGSAAFPAILLLPFLVVVARRMD